MTAAPCGTRLPRRPRAFPTFHWALTYFSDRLELQKSQVGLDIWRRRFQVDESLSNLQFQLSWSLGQNLGLSRHCDDDLRFLDWLETLEFWYPVMFCPAKIRQCPSMRTTHSPPSFHTCEPSPASGVRHARPANQRSFPRETADRPAPAEVPAQGRGFQAERVASACAGASPIPPSAQHSTHSQEHPRKFCPTQKSPKYFSSETFQKVERTYVWV